MAEEGKSPGINLYAIIGAKQVQIELLQSQLNIVSEDHQRLELENAELKLKIESLLNPTEGQDDHSNGTKENAANLLAGTDKPL